MTHDDIKNLDKNKRTDKEWLLLRNEKNVYIITRDDLIGVPKKVIQDLASIKNKPSKGDASRIFKRAMYVIKKGLTEGTIKIKNI